MLFGRRRQAGVAAGCQFFRFALRALQRVSYEGRGAREPTYLFDPCRESAAVETSFRHNHQTICLWWIWQYFAVYNSIFCRFDVIATAKFAGNMTNVGNDSESLKSRIGKLIRDKRLQAGYHRQGQLAEALGCDQSRVSRWESGREMPDSSYRKKLHSLIHTTEKDFTHVRSAGLDDEIAEAIERGARKVLANSMSIKSPVADYKGLSATKLRLIELVGRMNESEARRVLANLGGSKGKKARRSK